MDLLPTTSLSTSKPLELTPAGPLTDAAPLSTSTDIVVELEAPAPRPSFVDAGPSARALLERAASLGPMRGTLQSFVLPNDPILRTKMEPHVAERRARFRRVVKATLGACVALCAAALVATALSGGEAHASSSPTPARAHAATVVTSIEKLDSTARGKAQRDAREAVRPARRAAAAAPKHR